MEKSAADACADRLRGEVSELKAQIDQIESDKKQLSISFHQLKIVNSQLQGQNLELSDNAQQLQAANEALRKQLLSEDKRKAAQSYGEHNDSATDNLLIEKDTEITKLDMENQQSHKEIQILKEQNQYQQQRIENLVAEVQRYEGVVNQKDQVMQILETKLDYATQQQQGLYSQLDQVSTLGNGASQAQSQVGRPVSSDRELRKTVDNFERTIDLADQLVQHVKLFVSDFQSSKSYYDYIQLAGANLRAALELKFSPVDTSYNIEVLNEFLGLLFRELEQFFKTIGRLRSDNAEAASRLQATLEQLSQAKQQNDLLAKSESSLRN